MKNINYLRLLLSALLLGIMAFISMVIAVGDEESGFGPGFFSARVLPVIKFIFSAILFPSKALDKFYTLQSWWGLGLRITIGCVLYSMLIELIIVTAKAFDKKNRLPF